MTERKHISLVTWIGTGNYGTALQSFALHRYLADLGYVVSIVPTSPYIKGLRRILKIIAYKLGLLTVLTYFRSRKHTNKEKKFCKFVEENYNIPTLITSKEIDSYYADTDVLISGSDQIWNSYYKFDEFMFLGIEVDKRRVAYASSIGTNSVNPEFKGKVCELLLKYDYIGVREQEAVNVLSNLTGRNDIVQVLDPTFLLDADEWTRISEDEDQKTDEHDKYIMCYLIGSNDWYADQLEHVRKEYGIDKIIIVPSEENPDFKIAGAEVASDVAPLEFVRMIKNAALVCTDSFHATALSINLHRDFVEFVRFKSTDVKSQNSRIYDLLNHYGLALRLYSSDSSSWIGGIEYDSVDAILDEDRVHSRQYLDIALR